MKVYSIQSTGIHAPVRKCASKQNCKVTNNEVTFKSAAAKGAGWGALAGLVGLTIISGGGAAPLAYAIYAAVNGAAGGMLGHAYDKTKEDDKK